MPRSGTDGARDRARAALRAVPRRSFLPPDQRRFADEDRPLPIGWGATNSQPWTVAFMLRLLDPRPGERVLDVGSGSGWTTALLARLVGTAGSVIGVEIVPDLVTMGRANLGEDYPQARIELATAETLGWPDGAPYDRILVSADGGKIPASLEDQLAPGGRMVIPADDRMWVVDKDPGGDIVRSHTDGAFRFVLLRTYDS